MADGVFGGTDLEGARERGDSFTGGDVFWDADRAAVFGKDSTEVDQSFGEVYYDSASNEFRIDSTRDGAGTYRDLIIRTSDIERVSVGATTEIVFNDPGNNYDFRVEGDTVSDLLLVDASTDSVFAHGKFTCGSVSTSTALNTALSLNAISTTDNALYARIGLDNVGVFVGFAIAKSSIQPALSILGSSGFTGEFGYSGRGAIRWYDSGTTNLCEITSDAVTGVDATTRFECGNTVMLTINRALTTSIIRRSTFDSDVTVTQPARTSGAQTGFLFTGGALTNQTASTEVIDVNFNCSHTVQHAAGDYATQRAFLVQAPTYSFVAASTITDAATVAITGAPIAGTNATITNSWALLITGATKIDGKLTVTGAIDPTSISLSGGTAQFMEYGAGSTAALSASSVGRIRYNETSQRFEVSENGGAYVDLLVTGEGGWTDDGTIVRLTTASDSVAIGTATLLGSEKLLVSGQSQLNGQVTINESGSDVDFRVEGDTDANMIFVDASVDRVGIGQGAVPQAKLHVRQDTGLTVIMLENQEVGTTGPPIQFRKSRAGGATVAGDQLLSVDTALRDSAASLILTASITATIADPTAGSVDVRWIYNALVAGTNTEHFRYGAGDGFVVNDTGADLDTRIEGDTEANLFFVDASADTVGIRQATPTYVLDILANTTNGLRCQRTTAGTLEIDFRNTDVTAATSDVRFIVISGGAAGGDPYIDFNVNAAGRWTVGIDNSNLDSFTISRNAAPGTNNFLNLYSAGEVVWNEPGDNIDFRIEGDTEVNLFFVDASTDRIGIKENTPAFDVDLSTAKVGLNVELQVQNEDNTNAASDARVRIFVGGGSGGDPVLHFGISGVQNWWIGPDNSDSDILKISPNAALATDPAITVTTSGIVVFNESGLAAADVRIEGDTNINLLFSDASVDRVGFLNGTPLSSVDINGSFGLAIKTITNADSPYTVLITDYTLIADATAGAITINLPASASSTRRILTVKKIDASANTVTLDGSGAETIDDAATLVISTQYTARTIQNDGTEWWVI